MHGLETQVSSAETNDDRGIGDAGQRRHEANTIKGLIAGLRFNCGAGDDQVSGVVWQVSRGGCKIAWGVVLVQGSPRRGIARRLQERGGDQEQDDVTERLASAVSKRMFGHSPTEGEKAYAGTTYHYGLGSLACRVYGMVAKTC